MATPVSPLLGTGDTPVSPAGTTGSTSSTTLPVSGVVSNLLGTGSSGATSTTPLLTGAYARHPPPVGSAANPAPLNDNLLNTTVSGILGLQSQADIDNANAAASAASATGYATEAGAYTTASTVAGVAGDIEKLQTARKLAGTIGAQQAGVAAAGFREAGSAVDILKSSLQQGYFQQQITDTQTATEQAAFLAEAAGATGASNAATAEAGAYTAAASKTLDTAAAETDALTKFIERLARRHADALRGLADGGIDAGQPGNRVAQHRQQAVERECQHGGQKAERRERDAERALREGGEAEQQRIEPRQQGEARDGRHDARQRERDRAERRPAQR